MSSLRISLPGLSAYSSPDHPLAGRYVVEREIGSGGMAFVLLATDLKHKRPVALKVLRNELASRVNTERFLREIHIAAGLTHPHVLPVHDSGTADDLIFYVMPYVEGETLAARIEREGALPMDEALRIARQVASALAYAHDRGIVHRDIKPENVLLPGGVAVVADFGLARAIERDEGPHSRITDIGIALGTPTYLSPEQALGSRDVDARADQYSFACIVYEMLAGRPPFTAPKMQAMLAAHVSQPPPPIRKVKAGIPKGIEVALARALSKTPDDRFASVREFMDALDKAAPAAMAPGSAPAGGIVTTRRVVAAAAAVTLAFAAWSAWRSGRSVPGRSGLDDNVVAIAPFYTIGEPLAPWSEGLMDVLARSLDGAGPLRTVPPTSFVRSWKGRADRTSAAELGRATRAGLVVFGQLLAAGADSVHATVTLYDVRGDSAIGADLDVADVTSRMDRVADGITRGVLAVLSRARRIAPVSMASLGTRSLPALKAFLQGERQLRHGDYAGARAAYEQAVAVDSNFALALHRMRNVLRPLWLGSRPTEDSMLALGRRAGSLNHGLPLRDSLMILADSLLPGPHASRFIGIAEYQRSERRFAALERAAMLYPSDAEVLAELGEARLRVNRRGSDAASTLRAFEQAIAADSLFGPAYTNAVRLGLILRGRDSALALARRFSRIGTTDRVVGAMMKLLETDLSDAQLRRAAAALAPADARDAAFAMATWPDSAETAIRVFRFLASQPDSVSSQVFFGAALRFRGHMRESAAIADERFRYSPGASADLLLYSRYAPDGGAALDSLSQRWLTDGNPDVFPSIAARASDRQDTLALARLGDRARRGLAASANPVDSIRWSYNGGLTRAYAALVRTDSAAAEREFRQLPDTLASQVQSIAAVVDAARLYSRRGHGTEALALLSRHPPSRLGVSAFQPLWQLEMARAAAVAGDPATARANYSLVAAAWSRADGALKLDLADVASELRRRGIK